MRFNEMLNKTKKRTQQPRLPTEAVEEDEHLPRHWGWEASRWMGIKRFGWLG